MSKDETRNLAKRSVPTSVEAHEVLSNVLRREVLPRALFSANRIAILGLSGVKRLMDEFEIVSEVGHGTTVIAKKWKR